MSKTVEEKMNPSEGSVQVADNEAIHNHQRMLKQIAEELQLPLTKVKATVHLLDEGNTIPFIARYRKEMTGELDETQIRELDERLSYLRNLEQRKEEVIRIIDEQGKLSDSLRQAIEQTTKLQEVEDLYRPYRQKRKTRASVAKERGLEPLAEWIVSEPTGVSLQTEAQKYIDAEKEVHTVEDAVQGAMDIIAEMISDDAQIRAWVRSFSWKQGTLLTTAKNANQESVYEMYYDYQEPVRKLPPHRILAINRGEKEDVLKVNLDVPLEKAHAYIAKKTIHRESAVKESLQAVIEDAYKRLIAPAIERDIRNELTEHAEEQAIHIFSKNLNQLLLQPPIRGYVVLAVDPAFRTGCKLAVVDSTGKMLEVKVIYPTAPHHKTEEAQKVVTDLIRRYGVRVIAIGNGTASRESEQFIADVIQTIGTPELSYLIVNEAGASVYSASKLAKEEFPDLDVAERSAISIARRLQDPLAELVKIDPKSIGVGQYQHDVSQKRLEESLKAVVESAVNYVGVDLNTASSALLAYVAGINKTIAGNIVKYREQNGLFTTRKQLHDIPRLGAKAFEQCAGFLRISEGENPLDHTPIHPESYATVDRLFQELGVDVEAIGSKDLAQQLQAAQPDELAQKLDVGLPTLRDILDSLQRPGRDPRDELPAPVFSTDVLKIEDLKPGMELKGTVRNVIDFGAFVDIGVKNDGLVHISRLSRSFVKHPLDVVSVGDVVTVWVLDIDTSKGRVSLTMVDPKQK